MLGRLQAIREHIRSLVSVYLRTLDRTTIITMLPATRDDAGLLRFPIALRNHTRSHFLRDALRCGLFLETNYERLLPDTLNSEDFPNAWLAARNMVLLPLYTRLSTQDAQGLAETVLSIAEN